MGNTTIPGHRLVEVPIDELRRRALGDEPALDAVFHQLRTEYLSFLKYGHAKLGKGVTFHVVLTVQRQGAPQSSQPDT